MSREPREIICGVCGRNLLPGERSFVFLNREGEEVEVCELCRLRAEASGWLRPEQAAALRERGAPPPRRPRGQLLGGVLARQRERAAAAAARWKREEPELEPEPEDEPEAAEEQPAADPQQRRPSPREPAEEAPPPPARPAPTPTAAQTIAEAIEAFNASQHRRTVAGLSRSLGKPRASALAVRTRDGATGARLTVAWELSWYQWIVGPGQRGLEVRESGKGETIDQLRAADRTWNIAVAQDGTLRPRPRKPKREQPPEPEPEARESEPERPREPEPERPREPDAGEPEGEGRRVDTGES